VSSGVVAAAGNVPEPQRGSGSWACSARSASPRQREVLDEILAIGGAVRTRA
jgi:hypothetical protein